MEHRDDLALARRARLAYESARLRRAIVRAWPVPIAAWLAVRLGTSPSHAAVLAVALGVAAIVLVWRGGVSGRAVAPGLAAGTAPLVAPGLAMNCAVACSASCQTWCATSCVVAGILAGSLIGYRASREGHGGWQFAATAVAIAATTGAMGCAMAGAMGVTGMLIGLAAGTVPVFALVPRRS
jgi:hypothetical protein